ncbi:MFS transporter [Streptomyces sp. NRRL B-3229]|uniref:MFS transporter n=1 Tax=Streptomyces sp. NRRL B-3229 TaxID=1463836 RepID=UPI00099D5F52|nr:MFS transporter [Streptomyces sp. NRRL B-3229]
MAGPPTGAVTCCVQRPARSARKVSRPPVGIYFRLFRHRRFAGLCSGQIVSLIGDAFFPIIVVVAAAKAGTPAETIGAVFAARFVALGGVVLFSGALLDRFDPVRAAVVADSTRVVALAVLAFVWDGRLDAVVVAVAVLVGLCEAVSEPALLVIAPRVLDRRNPTAAAGPAEGPAPAEDAEVTAAYGLLEGLRNVSGMVGPTLAAAVVAGLGSSAGAVLAAVTFGLSAVATRWAGAHLVAGSRSDAPAQKPEPAGEEPEASRPDGDGPGEPEPEPEPSLLHSAMQGLIVLWRIPWLRSVQLLAVVHVVFAVGPWMVALPVFLVEGGHSATLYGFVLGAFAIGNAVGALVGGRIGGPRRGLYALALLALYGLTVLAPVASGSLVLLTVAFVAGGIGQQAFDVAKMTGLRRDVPEELHGRAFSADFFFSFASLPLGQLLGAALLRFADPRTIMLWGGALVLVSTAAVTLRPDVRRFSSAPVATSVPAAPTPLVER